jgi:hypothetical protein
MKFFLNSETKQLGQLTKRFTSKRTPYFHPKKVQNNLKHYFHDLKCNFNGFHFKCKNIFAKITPLKVEPFPYINVNKMHSGHYETLWQSLKAFHSLGVS